MLCKSVNDLLSQKINLIFIPKSEQREHWHIRIIWAFQPLRLYSTKMPLFQALNIEYSHLQFSLPEFSPKLLEQLTGLRSGPILEGDLFRLIGMIAGLGENALFNSEQNPRQEWKNDRRNMIDWLSTRSFIKLRNCFLFSQ